MGGYDYDAAFCPHYHRAAELVGRRWTGAIIRALLHGATHFSQIRDTIPDLTDKMLTTRLRELEAEGIVDRTVIPESPVCIEYHLTTKGRDLERAVRALNEWADHWLAGADRDGNPTSA
ncbi:winged helix-turn-helix transcriptional regulator [Saccharomonospora saliphila]|uniref:winged helix-turn-helix transcriptional regulator n=1 Tax=Saccharomonospora saliphila TaxID=369829 RepID=UPI000376C613|nr:helix-turn-helix domain-containing protein [Saccharomonospora saliphila]